MCKETASHHAARSGHPQFKPPSLDAVKALGAPALAPELAQLVAVDSNASVLATAPAQPNNHPGSHWIRFLNMRRSTFSALHPELANDAAAKAEIPVS